MNVPKWVIDRHNAENAKAHTRAQIDAQIGRLWGELCAAIESAVAGFRSLGGAVSSTGQGMETIAVTVHRQKVHPPEEPPREEVAFTLNRDRRSVRVSFASGRPFEDFEFVMGNHGEVEIAGPAKQRLTIEKLVEHILADVFYPRE